MGASILGNAPIPTGFKSWQEWAASLVLYLENQGETLTDALVAFHTDDQTLDTTGRLRVSLPVTAFESSFDLDVGPLVWTDFTSGTGTITYNTTRRIVTLATGGTASGARAMRQTRRYIRFRIGKSTRASFTGVPVASGTLSGAAKLRVGMYDDSDGYYFQVSAAGPAFVVRSSTSGSLVETVIPQASWNLDRLNGFGDSRATLDTSKSQRIVIEANGLGAERVRFGFYIGEEVVFAHELMFYNTVSAIPNVARVSLPIRWEAINDSATGANVSISQYSSNVITDSDGTGEQYYVSCASTQTTSVICGTASLIPVLSTRLKSTFGGATVRGEAHPYNLEIMNLSSSPGYYEIRLDTALTGASFASVGAKSILEYDVASTVMSGGDILRCGYIPSLAVGGFILEALLDDLKPELLATVYPSSRTILTLGVQGISGNVQVNATMNFREFY